jgi:glutathione synthase/RimK-type ligase-like ATP-grasp enzyme
LNGKRTTLKALLSKCKRGDKVSCTISDPRFMGIFYEFESRGASVFPSLLAQSLSMSKVHQAVHYGDHMIPHTQVVFRKYHIQRVLRQYAEQNILKSVVKEDRGSMGLGNHPCWSLNELARTIAHVKKPPVVVQPMLENFREFRLLVFGDTVFAKEKINSDQIFWKNRIFGGVTKLITPSKQVVHFGRDMMKLGKFPWAYIDLLITDDDIFLSEINVSGSNAGLKEYKINKLKRKMTEEWLAND